MVYKKLNSEFELPYDLKALNTEINIEAQQASFYYDRFIEHYHKKLRKNAEFWNKIYDRFDLPKRCMLEYNHTKGVVSVSKRTDERKPLKERDLIIKTLELEIEMLKKKLEDEK